MRSAFTATGLGLAPGAWWAMLGTLALALALGSLIVGQLILIPALAGDTRLIDANLARSLAEPLARTCATFVLIACGALAVLARAWSGQRAATSLALIAGTLAAFDRTVLLPRAQAAWARVDLVAGRPLARVLEAEQLQQAHDVALILLVVVLAGFALLVGTKRVAQAQ